MRALNAWQRPVSLAFTSWKSRRSQSYATETKNTTGTAPSSYAEGYKSHPLARCSCEQDRVLPGCAPQEDKAWPSLATCKECSHVPTSKCNHIYKLKFTPGAEADCDLVFTLKTTSCWKEPCWVKGPGKNIERNHFLQNPWRGLWRAFHPSPRESRRIWKLFFLNSRLLPAHQAHAQPIRCCWMLLLSWLCPLLPVPQVMDNLPLAPSFVSCTCLPLLSTMSPDSRSFVSSWPQLFFQDLNHLAKFGIP